jgi:hypothetical protein
MNRKEYITASEIGDFVYCKRGWWLRVQGLLSTNFAMQQGTQAHDNLFLTLIRLQWFRKVLLYFGIILLVILILLLLFI